MEVTGKTFELLLGKVTCVLFLSMMCLHTFNFLIRWVRGIHHWISELACILHWALVTNIKKRLRVKYEEVEFVLEQKWIYIVILEHWVGGCVWFVLVWVLFFASVFWLVFFWIWILCYLWNPDYIKGHKILMNQTSKTRKKIPNKWKSKPFHVIIDTGIFII